MPVALPTGPHPPRIGNALYDVAHLARDPDAVVDARVATLAATPERPRVTAIIPAWNESQTVGAVVDAVRGAKLVTDVIVVDNASTDATGAVAAAHGARVVQMPTPGKGQAMAKGAAATDAPILLFLDADLKGLTPAHVDRLAEPVVAGTADMTRGVIDRGPIATPLAHAALPHLTGQRAMQRGLFEALTTDDVAGWRVEASMNAHAAEVDARIHDMVLTGIGHRTKEEKYPSRLEGLQEKARMMETAWGAYAGYQVRHHLSDPHAVGAVDAIRAAATAASADAAGTAAA